MSKAAATELRNARIAVKAARTMLRNADVLGELTEHDFAAHEWVANALTVSVLWLDAMSARAEARQVRRPK